MCATKTQLLIVFSVSTYTYSIDLIMGFPHEYQHINTFALPFWKSGTVKNTVINATAMPSLDAILRELERES